MGVFKKRLAVIMLLCFVMMARAFAMEHPAVTLTANVTIVIDKAEDKPVFRAVADLQRDLNKVFNKAPRVVDNIAKADKGDVLIVVSCTGGSTKGFRDARVSGYESHLVTTCRSGNRSVILLQGADMRGTIYAVYTFSEKVLSIPPLWIWASYVPAVKTEINIPQNTYLYFPSPSVKYRAWFPNDGDLFDPWRLKSDENYDSMFETMLRLKMNVREGYLMDNEGWKTPYKAGKEACYARDRGLMISFTHTAPFGSSLKNWEKFWSEVKHVTPPELLVKNVDALKEFWAYHIETIKREHLEVIWQLGFRGKGDKPFWRTTFADAMDEPKADADRAKIIEDMLKVQVDLLKKMTGEANPLMKITIYNEGSDLLSAGLLHLPDEPNLILNYAGARHDHYPPPEIQNYTGSTTKPIGYYFNFQYTGTGSHLAPAEGPWKMEQSFRYVAAKIKHPIAFSVVNVGNIREYGLELTANAAMMWNTEAYKTDDALKSYCKAYYGSQNATKIAKLYTDYYRAYWIPRKATIAGFDRQYVFQDMRYARGVEQICNLFSHPYLADAFNDKNKGTGGPMATGGGQFSIDPADNNATDQVDAAINGTTISGAAFKVVAEEAEKVYQNLPPQCKPFFNDDLLLQCKFMAEANAMLNNMVYAYKIKDAGKPDECKAYITAALKNVKVMQDIKAQADHDRFIGWYAKDVNFNMAGLEKNISSLLKKQ